MKVRDEKMGVVTEALEGIRQIKFSALEKQWQAKIAGLRDRELAAGLLHVATKCIGVRAGFARRYEAPAVRFKQRAVLGGAGVDVQRDPQRLLHALW